MKTFDVNKEVNLRLKILQKTTKTAYFKILDVKQTMDPRPKRLGTVGSIRNSDHCIASGEYFQTPAPQDMICAIVGRIRDSDHCMASGQFFQTSVPQDKHSDTFTKVLASQNMDYFGQTTALICTNSGIVIKTSFHKFCDQPTQMWALQWLNSGQTTALICTNSGTVIKSSLQIWALQWSN